MRLLLAVLGGERVEEFKQFITAVCKHRITQLIYTTSDQRFASEENDSISASILSDLPITTMHDTMPLYTNI